MRRSAMYLCALAALAALTSACSGTVNQAPPSDTAGGQAGNGGSAGAAGSGGASGSAGAAGDAASELNGETSALSQACAAPSVGPPLLRLLNRSELLNTLNDIFPEVAGQWTATLPADSVSHFGFDNDGSTAVGPQAASSMLDTASALAGAVTEKVLPNLLPCASSTADHACAETFLAKYGRRLFRRALTAAEHDRYLAFFDSAKARSDFKTAIKWMIVALVQSPNAMYRREIGAVQGDGSRKLSPPEVATELAYTFTGSTPTGDLLGKADSGALGDSAALAKALLTTPRGKAVLHHFFASWLGYERVTSVEKPNVTAFTQVRSDMVQETRAFIDDVVVNKGGGLSELLTAKTTYPSRALATFYAFPAPGADYAAMDRPASRGLGVLAQGSFLSTHAQPNGSSPTQRGVFVFERLLCQDKPPVPANVPTIKPPQVGQITTRQRYEEQHASGGACPTCHKRFDPMGFGFEHFDEAGRYRQDEGGLPIDSKSNVPGPDLAPLFEFDDEEGLVRGLAKLTLAHQCFTGYLATYAFGVGASCLGASRVAALQNGTIGIADYFAALASEPHFTTRSPQ